MQPQFESRATRPSAAGACPRPCDRASAHARLVLRAALTVRQAGKEKGIGATCVELGKRFKYISEQSAGRFLYAVGEDVGEVPDKIRRKYGPD